MVNILIIIIVMQNKLTRHHIVPRSRWWTNNFDNIKMLKDNPHKSLHILFWNDTPVEQMWNLTFQINYTALADEFREDVRILLSETDPNYYYKNWLYRLKKYED